MQLLEEQEEEEPKLGEKSQAGVSKQEQEEDERHTRREAGMPVGLGLIPKLEKKLFCLFFSKKLFAQKFVYQSATKKSTKFVALRPLFETVFCTVVWLLF